MQAADDRAGAGRVNGAPETIVETVSRHEAFLRLGGAWNALAARADPSSIFLRHDWAAAAWAWRRQEGNPLILLVRRRGELVAIAPLLELEAGHRHVTLSWLSVPDNQEADLISAPDTREAAARALAGWLATHRARWSRLSLAQMPAESPTLPPLLAALREQGIPASAARSGINYAIELEGTWEDFYRTRSRRLKKGNNLVANRLRRAGTIELARLTGADITDAVGETLRALSASSWKQATATTFDHPGPGAFLDTLLERGRRGHWLVVWLLHLDGEPIAGELHLEHGGRAHALRADYLEHAAELSPGTYLNWKIIERLFETDLQRYELGPGGNPYKQRWTEDGLPLVTLDAWPPTTAGRLAAFRERRVRPALSRLGRAVRRIRQR